MTRSYVRPLGAGLFVLASLCAPSDALAIDFGKEWNDAVTALQSDQGHWRAVVSPYSTHFRPKNEHSAVWSIGLERQLDNHWLYGGSFFSNSFGQPSGYVYAGRQHPGLLDTPQLYFQWSIGLLYGYVGEYENKVPMNYKGLSPGALVSLGWQFTPRFATQLNLLGDAGVMLQFTYRW